MKKTITNTLLGLLALSPSVHAGDSDKSSKAFIPPIEAAKPQFRASVGGLYRQFEGVSFRSGDHSSRAALPTGSSSVGSADSIDNRTYSDGFVNRDREATPNDKLTWFWGYNNSSQVQGGNLTYTGDVGYDSGKHFRGDWSEDDDAYAPYLAIDYLIPVAPRLSVGPFASFSYAEVSGGKSGFTTFTTQSLSVRDTYALQGVIPPSAPYGGTFDGPGPVINNIPTSRTFGGAAASAYNRIHESVDVNLWTITLGGSVDYALDKVHFTASGGLTVNVADYDASHDEVLLLQNGSEKKSEYRRFQDRSSGTDIILGASVQLGLSYEIAEYWSIGAFGRYDWTQSLDKTVGPSSFDVDFDGWSAGINVTYLFR